MESKLSFYAFHSLPSTISEASHLGQCLDWQSGNAYVHLEDTGGHTTMVKFLYVFHFAVRHTRLGLEQGML